VRAYGYGVTDDRSTRLVGKLLSENPQVETLVLKYMPGTQDADMNLRLARRIRKAGLNTHLEADSRIASGAVDLFLAGVGRTMECGALIGVHSWGVSDVYDAQDAIFDDRRKRQEKFLRDMGVDERFYVFTREAAPAADIHILTMEEIRRFGLLTEDPNCDD